MELLFVIIMALIIYAVTQTQNKNEEKKERQYAERNAAYLKYKNIYEKMSKKELKKIDSELKNEFDEKFKYYEKYVYSHTYMQDGRELTKGEKFHLVFEEFAKNEPDFYYRCICANRLSKGEKLSDSRFDEGI